MGKINTNSRDNLLSSVGILNLLSSRVDQEVNTDSTPTFAGINITTGTTTVVDLEVTGDLTVSGATTILSTDILEITDNIIEINASGGLLGEAGLEINRGIETPYRIIFDETDDSTKIGQVGSLQKVATRQDTPLDKGIMVYNDALKRLDSTQTIELSTSFTSGQASTTSASGALTVSGGLGVTGQISMDNTLNFLGSGTYSNSISSSVTDIFTITANSDIILSLPVGDTTSIPVDTFFSYDGATETKRIYATSTLLNIQNSTGDITFLTANNSNLNIPQNTFINWGTNNRIRYNSTDITLESSGNFVISPITNVTDSTVSINNTTGSIITAGGFASSNTTDAVSYLNGGGSTLAGGLAVGKSAYIGNSVSIGEFPVTATQISGQGVNFRSKSRTLVTNSTNNTAFNSVEGGNISTAVTIPIASTMYINSAPTVSGGGSITESYSLQVNSGISLFADTTASASISSAALVLDGGLSISNTTNSTSYDSGGNITLKGGLGAEGDIYTAGKVDTGALGLSATQVSGIGLNFRSRDRTLTTVSTNNATFNSFEGGSISTAATIPAASTVYINSAPTVSGGGSITDSYALRVESGISSFVGDVRIEGAINIDGELNMSTPAVVISNETNITGVVTQDGNRNYANGTYRTFSATFIMTPTVAGAVTSFEFTIPERVTNFVNFYDTITNINGFFGATPGSVENCVSYSVVSSTRGSVRYTASSTGSHIIQVTVMYLAI